MLMKILVRINKYLILAIIYISQNIMVIQTNYLLGKINIVEEIAHSEYKDALLNKNV